MKKNREALPLIGFIAIAVLSPICFSQAPANRTAARNHAANPGDATSSAAARR
jgi:hypothetical protein